jgi:hypothetical protein
MTYQAFGDIDFTDDELDAAMSGGYDTMLPMMDSILSSNPEEERSIQAMYESASSSMPNVAVGDIEEVLSWLGSYLSNVSDGLRVSMPGVIAAEDVLADLAKIITGAACWSELQKYRAAKKSDDEHLIQSAFDKGAGEGN